MPRRARTWTPEQRAEASRRRLGTKPSEFETEYGVQYCGLVYHPRNTYNFAFYLAYEAYMNDKTLEEWVILHRNGKFGGEVLLYLPILATVVTIDRNSKNIKRENLYCFLTVFERMKWQARGSDPTALEQNEEEVKYQSRQYGKLIFKQRNPSDG